MCFVPRAWLLWEQYQKKAELFSSEILLVPHGDDFRYETNKEWMVQFGNMEKLMNYINTNPKMNMKVCRGSTCNLIFRKV